MLADVWNLLVTRWDFFSGLLLEHIGISAISIAIAIVVGGIAGVLIRADLLLLPKVLA